MTSTHIAWKARFSAICNFKKRENHVFNNTTYIHIYKLLLYVIICVIKSTQILMGF